MFLLIINVDDRVLRRSVTNTAFNSTSTTKSLCAPFSHFYFKDKKQKKNDYELCRESLRLECISISVAAAACLKEKRELLVS